jgi:ankyrin repeat protein
MNGHAETTKLLLAKGADVNAKTASGLTAVDLARGQTNLEMLKLLWDHGAPVVTDSALEGFLDQLRFDLIAKASRSMLNGEPADACHVFIIEQLSNFKSQEHFTTNQLLQAQVCAFRTIAKAVQKMATEESINASGVIGANNKRRESIKQFTDLLLEIQRDSAVQRDVLFYAAHFGETGTVKWLLEHGAPVNAKDQDGFTPLMWAAFKGDVDTVKVLLNSGADADLKDNKGWTATMFAASQSRTEALEALLTKKPDLNAVNQEGQNALGIARLKNQAGAVVALKDAGASEQ